MRTLLFNIVLLVTFIGSINFICAQQKAVTNTKSQTNISIIPADKKIKTVDVKSENANGTYSKKTNSQNYPQTISSGTRKKVLTADSYTTKEECLQRIVNIESHIAAIDYKVNYIESDQTQKEEAIQSGWFDEMARIKSELIEEKKQLNKKLSTLE